MAGSSATSCLGVSVNVRVEVASVCYGNIDIELSTLSKSALGMLGFGGCGGAAIVAIENGKE
jgi:hypothetical protein